MCNALNNIDLCCICLLSFIAAHCCKIGQTNHNVPPSVLYVSLGRYRLREWYEPGSINQEIVNYTIHPDYTHTGSGDSDLAILVLKTPIQFSSIIKPICMWFGETSLQSVVNKSGYVVGWGRDEFGNPYLAEPRMARVPIVSQVRIFIRDCYLSIIFVYLVTMIILIGAR